MIGLLLTVERVATGDVTYYWSKISGMREVGLSQTLIEYPTPVAWMLSIPYGVSQLPQLFGVSPRISFVVAFVVGMLVLDAVFTRILWRNAGRRRDAAVSFWLLFIFLMGPIAYLRFDLVLAVLAGGALLLARRRPALTGLLTAIGAGIKLWPALLIAPFTTRRDRRRTVVLAFVVTGVVLALLSLIFGGMPRLVSPLTWQSDRGLQIESLWATPLMFLRLFRPNRWIVATSRYQAFEVFGPGTPGWLAVSTIATMAGLAFLLVLFIRGCQRVRPSPTAVGLMVLATITILAVANKTLSPQYLLWFGGPIAVLLIGGRRGHRPRLPWGFAVGTLALAVATQLIYPITYSGLYSAPHGRLFVAATLLLVLRNLGILTFTVAVCIAAWKAVRPRRDHASPRRRHHGTSAGRDH